MPHTNRNIRKRKSSSITGNDISFKKPAFQQRQLPTSSDSIDSSVSQTAAPIRDSAWSMNISSKHARIEKFSPENLNRRLLASKFRKTNEELESMTSAEIFKHFNEQTDAFREYHTGYSLQSATWPHGEHPIDAIIEQLSDLPAGAALADMGCGEARLARDLPAHITVHSFDCFALNDRVTVADMAQVPLEDDSVDVVVFCLSLMGTNLAEIFLEANRILKLKGRVLVAELQNRFENVRSFVRRVQRLGFKLKSRAPVGRGNMFVLLEFRKVADEARTRSRLLKRGLPHNLPQLTLKPFRYKKR